MLRAAPVRTRSLFVYAPEFDNRYHAVVALLTDRSESSVRRVVAAKGIKPKVQRGGSKPRKEWTLEELAELRLKLLKRLARRKRCVLSFSKQVDDP